MAGIPGRVRKYADFLEMAQLIQQARIFIGNQSLAAAIAEGLKAPRIIDLPIEPCNAFPIGPKGYVLPAVRAEFVAIVHRLCGDRPRLASLYSDILRAVASQTSGSCEPRPETGVGALSLIGAVDAAQFTLEGGGWTRLSAEENGVFLHPGPEENSPARALFDRLRLAGQNHNTFIRLPWLA